MFAVLNARVALPPPAPPPLGEGHNILTNSVREGCEPKCAAARPLTLPHPYPEGRGLSPASQGCGYLHLHCTAGIRHVFPKIFGPCMLRTHSANPLRAYPPSIRPMYGAHGWSIKKHGMTTKEMTAKRDVQYAIAVEKEKASLASFGALRKPANLRGEAVREKRSHRNALMRRADALSITFAGARVFLIPFGIE